MKIITKNRQEILFGRIIIEGSRRKRGNDAVYSNDETFEKSN